MEQVETPKDIVKFAKNLIRSGEEGFKVLQLHVLETEDDQHDDELINSVIIKFSQSLQKIAFELEKDFGIPQFTIDGEDNDEDDMDTEYEELFYVPCSFSSAVWIKEDQILYLAVVQEDREFPISLIMGVEF